ncbi:response regulator transcription factor, partial [Escherichia coli]
MMGSELVKWVKSHKIDAHIITFVAKMPYIDSIKLLEAGAKGCVWKTSHPAKLNRWICPYISRHLLSLNPLLACCRRYSRG